MNNSPRLLPSKTPKIYKSKKLNTANFGNFTHSDYQIFLHLVSKIGGVDEFGKYLQPHQLEREHVLTAKEFSAVFNRPIGNIAAKKTHKELYEQCFVSLDISTIHFSSNTIF